MPPSLAEVIHLIRSRGDSAPGFITTETRLVSGLGFCSDDMEELLHEAEWRFGVRFPSDENALRELFSTRMGVVPVTGHAFAGAGRYQRGGFFPGTHRAVSEGRRNVVLSVANHGN